MSNGERRAVYTICPRGEGKKDFWLRIGTMWTNRDGSFTITLDALPLGDRLVIREEQPRDEQQGSGGGNGNGGGLQRRGNGNGQQRQAAPPPRRNDDFDYQSRGPSDDEIPF